MQEPLETSLKAYETIQRMATRSRASQLAYRESPQACAIETVPPPLSAHFLSEAGEFVAPRSLAARAGGALARRAKLWFQGRRPFAAGDAASLAARWLGERSNSKGVRPHHSFGGSCTGLTAACLSTLTAFGWREQADAARDWLLSTQLEHGAFPDGSLSEPSLFHTGLAVRHLRGETSADPRADAAVARACEFLASSIDSGGRVRAAGVARGAIDHWAPISHHVVWLAALRREAVARREATWDEAATRGLARLRRGCDLSAWDSSTVLVAHRLSALLDLAEFEPTCSHVGQEMARRLAAAQLACGAVPSEPCGKVISTQGVAHLARLWYASGAPTPADRAIAWLRGAQLADGGFPCDVSGRAVSATRSTWTCKFFLDAAAAQVASAFRVERRPLPRTIASDDPRLALVIRAIDALPAWSRVADIGCGSGRYLRHAVAWRRDVRWIGIDSCERLLAELPRAVEARRGGLLSLPAADGEFDAVFAIESIEHALDAERAVAELCRVTRGGGSVIVIDKDRRQQPLSEHEPWERWLDREETSRWLAAECEKVEIEPLSVGQGRRGLGPYVAWNARKRVAAETLRAAA